MRDNHTSCFRPIPKLQSAALVRGAAAVLLAYDPGNYQEAVALLGLHLRITDIESAIANPVTESNNPYESRSQAK